MIGARRGVALVVPAIGLIVVFVILPLAFMAYVSTLQRDDHGMVAWGRHTVDAYVQFLFERDLVGRWSFNTDYLRIFARSIGLSAVTTATTLVLGFPVALWLALQPERRRPLLVFLVTVPFWTNLLVRNFAWILLLRDGGVIDTGLRLLHVSTGPVGVLYTPLATSIGLTYSFLPFMILPLYVSLEKIDRRLIEAGFDLGANHWRVLMRVIVPLARAGFIGGAVLVFIPSLGAFISPELLGGAKSMMIGNLIQEQFGQSRNWPFGAALSFVLLAMVLASLRFSPGRLRGRGTAR